MKRILQSLVINLVALFIINQLLGGFQISGSYEGFLFAAAVLTGINLAIKPLVRLLLLPVNLITLGAFRWVANVFSLYLVTLLVPYLEVVGFDYPGFTYQGFIIPEMYLAKIWVLIIASFLISLITTFLFWLFK